MSVSQFDAQILLKFVKKSFTHTYESNRFSYISAQKRKNIWMNTIA